MPGSSSGRTGKEVVAPLLAAGLGLLPVLLGLARGGYFASTWLGAGAALAVATLVLVYGRAFDYPGLSRRLPQGTPLVLALFAAFCLWNAASLLWAADRAAALTEVTRTVFMVLLFGLALAVLRTARARDLFLSTLVLGTAATSAIVVTQLARDPGWTLLFNEIKMVYPLGYANANGAFFAMMVYPALFLASRRSGRVWARSLFFAAAVLLLQMTLLSQSRGAFWALIASGVVYLVITPHRIRAALWGGAALAFFLVTYAPLNVLRLDLRENDLATFIPHASVAARTVLLSVPAALAAGALLAFVDRRLVVRGRLLLGARILAGAGLALLLVVTFVNVPAVSDPVGTVDRAWATFSGREGGSADWSRTVYFLDMSGSGRYPVWVLAWRVFEEHPALGVGADNYLVEWQQSRPTPFAVRQPHNLYLRLLSELGIPGFLLFAAPVALVMLGGVVRLWSRPWAPGRPAQRAAFAALFAAGTYFLVHELVEWLWNFPALAGSFFLLLGAMAAIEPAPAADDADAASAEKVDAAPATPIEDDASAMEVDGAPSEEGGAQEPEAPPGRRPWRGSVPLVLAATAGVVLFLCAPQFLAQRSLGHARTVLAQGDTVSARRSAGWAALLNPLESAPYVIEGRAWAAEGATDRSEAAFRRAVTRDPTDWQTYAAWARIVEKRGGDPAPLLQKARALNPLEPSLQPGYRTAEE